MKTINVPSRRWYENREREIHFPERWKVENLTVPGLEKPAMNVAEIRKRIEQPCAGPPLRELAGAKKQAVVVFDDMTRPTPIRDVGLIILEELHRGGMRKDQIRFIWALGSHGTYDMIDARKKLGDEIVENYAVFNHDAFQNTERIGRTPTGVELWFNREFLSCDLKIGIGSCAPHVQVGFGGGAKIILPGVAGIETINQFHNQQYRDVARTGLGNFDNNIMRAECEAAGDMAGLNFKVDCLINRRGEIASVYAGAFRETHGGAVQEAREAYGIPYSADYDILVSNAYGRANESAIAAGFFRMMLKPQGTGVLICDAPEGQVPHYVFRSWGSGYGGRHYRVRDKGILSFMKRLIVLNPMPDPTSLDLFCHEADAEVVKTWPEVLARLEENYPQEARVGVIPDGTMQYLKAKA